MPDINALIQNLQYGSDTQRRASSYKLGKINDPAVVLPLIKAYIDPDAGVRRNVVEGLQQNADQSALYFLSMPETARVKISEYVRETDSMPPVEEIQSFTDLPLPELPVATLSEPSSEAREHLERAYQMLEQVSDGRKLDDPYKLDIASELALAIHTAGAPFPRAHSLLAVVLNDLKDDKRALYHAQQALQYQPNEFRAQLVKIDVGLKDVKILNLKPGDFIELKGSFENMALGTIGRGIGALIATGTAGLSQASFMLEVQKLATIFTNLSQTNTDVDEYLFMANTLLGLGDLIVNTPIITGRPDLYKLVADTPTETLDSADRSDEVRDVKRKALGRYFLYRS